VDPPGINVHGWEVCHRESRITVSSRCSDTFDQLVYLCDEKLFALCPTLKPENTPC
jgi:hypothetical protein